ncbi:hypothetical protein K437DRAFT_228788 [Tilletiaria anomala UBC 951]|uniref:intramembrane prenyl-peptidase Rce1 n=1 Tax=Tilletiaria anomala (strain ATCC 24038 / CBS 436.72 / UBC 951) TaxID=1037660 RepID=A0A066VHM5_TILAU|nr:uncharacterized protein K437DRAFT_228788 [Tilletiaria anomala UBC 951]KDN38085.1 hypothetical protein K437DRAFT_228788 [Tilletiaria anomala UBC 951]
MDRSLSLPLLSTGNAIFTCSAATLSYVGSIYLFSAHRIGSHPAAQYDNEKLIRHRLRMVSFSTLTSLVGCAATIWSKLPALNGTLTLRRSLRLLGIPLPEANLEAIVNGAREHLAPAVAFPLGLTALIYCGPLYCCFLDQSLPFQRQFSFKRDVLFRFSQLQGLRTFVVGPLTEELVFRSCIIGVSLCSGFSRMSLIFLTPAYFSIAHFHHAWENYVGEGKTRKALKRSVQRAIFQMLYTAIFGWYANTLLLRTGEVPRIAGNVIVPFLSHVFCNVMGLPDLFHAEETHPQRKLSIRMAHLAGIAAFVGFFGRLTRPTLFGGSALWQQ